jgi:RNA polymerase sigma factor for flagellar operon FliA
MSSKRKGLSENRTELISDYMNLIQTIAAQITSSTKFPPGFTFDDLVSFGVEGLIKASETYDSRKGSQFKTYASYRIRGEMLDRIRDEWRYRNFILPKIQRKIVDLARESLEFGDASKDSESRISDIISSSAIIYILSLDGIQIVSSRKGMGDPAEEIIDDIEFNRQRVILKEAMENCLTDEEKKVVEYFYNQELTQKEIADLMKLSRSKIHRLHQQILNKLKAKLKDLREEV